MNHIKNTVVRLWRSIGNLTRIEGMFITAILVFIVLIMLRVL